MFAKALFVLNRLRFLATEGNVHCRVNPTRCTAALAAPDKTYMANPRPCISLAHADGQRTPCPDRQVLWPRLCLLQNTTGGRPHMVTRSGRQSAGALGL